MADSSAVVVRWAYEPVFGDGGGCLSGLVMVNGNDTVFPPVSLHLFGDMANCQGLSFGIK